MTVALIAQLISIGGFASQDCLHLCTACTSDYNCPYCASDFCFIDCSTDSIGIYYKAHCIRIDCIVDCSCIDCTVDDFLHRLSNPFLVGMA